MTVIDEILGNKPSKSCTHALESTDSIRAANCENISECTEETETDTSDITMSATATTTTRKRLNIQLSQIKREAEK